LGTVTTLKSKKIAPEKATIENLSPAFAESFKSIRTAVLLFFSDALAKCLLVTSMAPSEGKTTAAVNLAVSMAQAGWQVLLIDADMRKPRIHNILELSNNKGLSNYLTGLAGGGIIQKSQEQNLDVITSGPIPPNPSELLISELTQKLIKLKEANYDLIIFDSPPILTVSDGLILGKLVDNIVLVARASKTTWTMLEKGRRSLTNIGGKILGVIINGKEIEKKDYHYYYNHYYRSYNKGDYL
jgi:capsular exopolysaccharide synthesis family protein